MRISVADALAAKQTKKRKFKQPVTPRAKRSLYKPQTRKSPSPSASSEESDTDVAFTESGDSDVDDIDYEVIGGGFAVVKFRLAKKSRCVHYIARVDSSRARDLLMLALFVLDW